MSEPSKEAWELAHRVDKPVYMLAHDLTWLAAALQKLMDERDALSSDVGRLTAQREEQKRRAELAEAEGDVAFDACAKYCDAIDQMGGWAKRWKALAKRNSRYLKENGL
jgi:hypothetical protein